MNTRKKYIGYSHLEYGNKIYENNFNMIYYDMHIKLCLDRISFYGDSWIHKHIDIIIYTCAAVVATVFNFCS
jgi:hypothetical protein